MSRRPPHRPSDDQPKSPPPDEPEFGPNLPAMFDDDGVEHRQIIVNWDIKKRIDSYLHDRLKGISRSRVQKLIDWGGVRVNGKPPKASTTLRAGDVIDVILPPPAVRQIKPEAIPLSILYEDDSLIIINKQANLIVHPARGNLSGTLLNALAHHLLEQGAAKAAQKSLDDPTIEGLSTVGAQEFRPGVVHRLDRNTTGVMVVAKTDVAHWQIARQFEERGPLKVYLALVHGSPEDPAGVIEEPIGKHPTIREAYAVRHDSQSRSAVTIYRVRERFAGYSLVELELKTGRTHQIRVHLSYLGFPIVGDIVYGGEPVGPPEVIQPPIAAGARRYVNFARDKEEGQRVEARAKARPDMYIATPALHATLLAFNHPTTRKRLTFTAPVHEPMANLLRELRLHPAPGPVIGRGSFIDLTKATPS